MTSVLAGVLLLCVSALSVSAQLHDDSDDPICNPVVFQDGGTHHVAATSAAQPAPQHCFICHWLSLRTVQATVRLSLPTVEGHTLLPVSASDLHAIVAGRQPARAPPLA